MNKLDLNKSNDLSALKESFNKIIDKKIADAKLNEKIADTSKLSFFESKTIIDSILDKLYESTDGKRVISSYVKLIKENKTATKLYQIVESISSSDSDDALSVAHFVGDMCNEIHKKELCECEKEIRSILSEAFRVVPIDYDSILSDSKKLNESVDYLCSHKRSMKTMNEHINRINNISDIIKNNVNTEAVNESLGTSNKELLESLNTLMANDFKVWENKVIKDLSLCEMSSSKKSDLFEDYKNDCIKVIDEMIEESELDDKARLFSIKEKLNEKVYSEETLTEDLFKLAELKETLTSE